MTLTGPVDATAQLERDQAILDGFIERYEALADECDVVLGCGYDGIPYFTRGLAERAAP